MVIQCPAILLTESRINTGDILQVKRADVFDLIVLNSPLCGPVESTLKKSVEVTFYFFPTNPKSTALNVSIPLDPWPFPRPFHMGPSSGLTLEAGLAVGNGISATRVIY